eukprot:GEMP01007279.1.p1 GENE.GEMP01007279.1~~GEMP01007279.1.p1  ORF type:complete len:692 (+),score=142.92 GEMP01007279.1:228-2303(+)
MLYLCALASAKHQFFLEREYIHHPLARSAVQRTERRAFVSLLDDSLRSESEVSFDDNGEDGLSEGRYLSKGCYRVENLYQGLTGTEPAPSYESAEMSLDKCYYHCVEHRSLYFVLRDGAECSCIDRQVTCKGDFEKLSIDDCDVPCTGKADEKCGGRKAHSVYLNAAWVKKVKTKACGKPPQANNAKKMCEASEGGGCEVECEEGYIEAANNLLCDTALGQWVGLAQCIAVTCHSPPPIAFALSMCSHAQVPHDKEKCEVRCLQGYDLVINSLACSKVSDKDFVGRYEGEARCEAKSCGSPAEVENSLVPPGPVSFPKRVHYQCKVGYSVDGSVIGLSSFSSQCLTTGEFEKHDFACKAITCGPAPQLEGAKRETKGDVTFSQSALYTCDEGFTTDSSPTGLSTINLPCQASGTFPDPLPKCEGIVCGAPLSIMFAIHKEISSPKRKSKQEFLGFGESTTYDCEPGYTTNGNKSTDNNTQFTIECKEGFRGLESCVPVICGNTPKIANAISSMQVGVFSEHIHYACEQGHSLDGTSEAPREFTISCQPDGSFTEAPGCKPLLCGGPPKFAHSSLQMQAGKNVVFPEQISYRCADGYSVDKTSSSGAKSFIVACQDNGQLSVPPACQDIDDCIGHSCGPYGRCLDQMLDYQCQCEQGYEEQVYAAFRLYSLFWAKLKTPPTVLVFKEPQCAS